MVNQQMRYKRTAAFELWNAALIKVSWNSHASTSHNQSVSFIQSTLNSLLLSYRIVSHRRHIAAVNFRKLLYWVGMYCTSIYPHVFQNTSSAHLCSLSIVLCTVGVTISTTLKVVNAVGGLSKLESLIYSIQYVFSERIFLKIWWPNQQCQRIAPNLTRLTSPCYSNTTCVH